MHHLDIADMARKAALKMAEQQVQRILSLIDWAKRYCPHFLTREISKRFHIPLTHTLECAAAGENIDIICPRGYAKTTWIQLNILRDIVEQRERYILLIMDSSEQAIQSLKTITEELEHNKALREAYPGTTQKGAVWNQNEIVTAAGVCVQAVGTGKKLRGRRFRESRPTKIVLDDPQNDDNILSPQQRKDDWNWFTKVVMKCGDEKTRIFLIGTVLHKECMVCLAERDPSFKVIRYRAIIRWPKNTELWDTWKQWYLHAPKRDIDGVTVRDTEAADDFYKENKIRMHEGAEVLWPEKESLYDLMKEWAANPIAFASEKQNEAFDPTNSYFDPAWFMPDRKEIWYDHTNEFEKKNHITIGYIDWSKGKETKAGDYCALIIAHYDGEHCWLECDIQKVDPHRMIGNVIGWHRQVNFLAVGCETQGFQSLAKQEMEAQMQEEQITIPIYELENGNVPKQVRIARLSSYCSRGYFKFKRNCEMTEILIDQLVEFGNPRAHDDGPDALEGVTRILHSILEDGFEFVGGGFDYDEDERIIGKIS